jgi:PemK-like, MazF-like toxin of type II toxin-antitoxin system
MTAYSFGDVVLVPFPFTDQTGNKKRPAVVVSSAAYHRARTDLILMAVTSQIRASGGFGEASIAGWKEAGLLKPSTLKPILFTVERLLILRKLGQLGEPDRGVLRRNLAAILEVSSS